MGLSSRLKNRVDLYGPIEIENEIHEKDFKYEKIKDIWTEIRPQTGGVLNDEGNTSHVEYNYRIILRVLSVQDINLSRDMYFMYRDQKYQIKYFNPNYKFLDQLEIFCEMVVE